MAADTVTVAAAGGAVRLSGRIVDYTGEKLELETPEGGLRAIKPAQVIGFSTDLVANHTAADRAFAEGRYAEALALYGRAVEEERRPWVRRLVMAQIVRCRRALGQTEQAVEGFLVLVQSDSATLHFDCIPLAWVLLPSEPGVELAAQRWAARREPVARLLAASHLLASSQQSAAISLLDELSRDPNSLVAWAARAQLLRTHPIALPIAGIEQQRRDFADAPGWLQPGVSYAFGRAWVASNQPLRAASAFLRCGLTEPCDRAFAAQAMLEAGLALSQAGWRRESDAVWRETVAKLGDQRRVMAELASRDPQRWGPTGTEHSAVEPAPLPLSRPLQPTAFGAVNDEGHFLAALRDRGLSRLAAQYCEWAFDCPDLSPQRRAELSIELARSLTVEALAAPPAERERIWSRVEQTVAQFVDRHPDHPWTLLVRIQGLMARSAWAESVFHEALAHNRAPSWLDRAKEALRGVLRQWEQLAAELEQRQRNATAGLDREPALPVSLAALRRTAAFEIASIYRLQAECYPADSDDRTHALLMAAKLLLPLAQSDGVDPLRWRSRLALVACYRMLGDYDSAAKAIDSLRQTGLNDRQELALHAEDIRLTLAQRRIDEAVTLAEREVASHTSPEPECDLARLEAYLLARQRAAGAGRSAEAAKWLRRADAHLRDIEQRHGPAWRRRGEVLFAAAVGLGETADAAMLVRIAENAYHSEQYDESIAAYDSAVSAMIDANDLDRAFDLAFTAATIAHRLARHEDACARYQQIARKHPRHPKAPEAHLLAVGHAAELARTNEDEPLQQYRALLVEHIERWPASPTANEARWRLARLFEYQQRWQEAAETYQSIVGDDARRAAAVASVERCTNALLSQLSDARRRAATATKAAEWFESIASEALSASPPRWRPHHCAAALAATRIGLAELPGRQLQAAALLHQALRECQASEAPWRASAESALIVAYAGAGRGEQALEVLSGWSDRQAAELETLLDGLAELGKRGPPDALRAVAAVQLRTIDILQSRRGELSAEARRRLDQMRADALLSADRREEAFAAYSSLAAADDSDAAAHEGCARTLSASSQAADWERALMHWGAAQKGRPQGSPEWLRAQLAMADLELRLGRKAAGAHRLRLIERQYPDSGTPELRDELRRLMRQAGS